MNKLEYQGEFKDGYYHGRGTYNYTRWKTCELRLWARSGRRRGCVQESSCSRAERPPQQHGAEPPCDGGAGGLLRGFLRLEGSLWELRTKTGSLCGCVKEGAPAYKHWKKTPTHVDKTARFIFIVISKNFILRVFRPRGARSAELAPGFPLCLLALSEVCCLPSTLEVLAHRLGSESKGEKRAGESRRAGKFARSPAREQVIRAPGQSGSLSGFR